MRWPPYEHIFFDCDSTLTTVEGIDILAESAGKKWRVEVLTQAAMDGNLKLEDVYAKRLRAVKPTRSQVRSIRRAYKRNVVADAVAVIAALQELGHTVYIISGGLAEPVEEFGVFLGVPRAQIRAVGVTYNELSGQWWVGGDARYLDYDAGALTVSDGKAQIVKKLLGQQSGRSLLIGDGSSDLLASHAVDLFVGFGGVTRRQRVLDEAPVYLHSSSLAPLLAIAGGPSALRRVAGSNHRALGAKALELIQQGAYTFNNARLATKFEAAFEPAFAVRNGRSAQQPPRRTERNDGLNNWLTKPNG